MNIKIILLVMSITCDKSTCYPIVTMQEFSNEYNCYKAQNFINEKYKSADIKGWLSSACVAK